MTIAENCIQTWTQKYNNADDADKTGCQKQVDEYTREKERIVAGRNKMTLKHWGLIKGGHGSEYDPEAEDVRGLL